MSSLHSQQAKNAAAALDALVRDWGPDVALSDLSRLRRDVDRAMYALVEQLREGGVSWASVGRLVGTSKQAAQQRFRAKPEPEPEITAPLWEEGAEP